MRKIKEKSIGKFAVVSLWAIGSHLVMCVLKRFSVVWIMMIVIQLEKSNGKIIDLGKESNIGGIRRHFLSFWSTVYRSYNHNGLVRTQQENSNPNNFLSSSNFHSSSGKLLHCSQLNYKKKLFQKVLVYLPFYLFHFFLASAAVITTRFFARHSVIKENC
jgi:hypothetical protein